MSAKSQQRPRHDLFYKTNTSWWLRHIYLDLALSAHVFTPVCAGLHTLMKDELYSKWCFEASSKERNHTFSAVRRGEDEIYHHLWGGQGADKKMHTQDTNTPTASQSVISERLPASASQQLNETLQPPPSQPTDSENPPLAHTRTHTTAQSHAGMMPIGTDLLIDLNSVYSNHGHEDRPLLAAQHHNNGFFLCFYNLIFESFTRLSSRVVFLLLL